MSLDPSIDLPFFPVSLKLQGRPALVVGDDAGAKAKARLLTRAGAKVIHLRSGDAWPSVSVLRGLTVMIVATACPVVAAEARRLADLYGILLNVVDRPDACDWAMPALVERGPLLVAISSAGAAPALVRQVRQVIERAVPPAYGRLAALCRAARGRVRRLLGDAGQRRRFWDRVVDGPVARAMLAGDTYGAARQLETDLHAALSGAAPDELRVSLVGAGPGAADLLTLRAAKLIAEADIVLHDALVSPDILALARREAMLLDVGKRSGRHSRSQDDINQMIFDHLAPGRCVVRLKGGDPFIFGRGGEEADFLEARGVMVDIVPGITAALAASASLRAPLTRRGIGRSVTFATGHLQAGAEEASVDWRALASADGTVAIYMGRDNAGRIIASLIAGGMAPSTPAIAVENVSLPDQRDIRTSLLSLPAALIDAQFNGPTLLLVGKALTSAPSVASLRLAAE